MGLESLSSILTVMKKSLIPKILSIINGFRDWKFPKNFPVLFGAIQFYKNLKVTLSDEEVRFSSK